MYRSYIVERGTVRRLGIAVGGSGVMSLRAADLLGLGRDQLYYTFSWGSGLHRSQVGAIVWDDAGRHEVLGNIAHTDDMMLREPREKKLEVEVRRFLGAREKKRPLLGHLKLERVAAKGGKPVDAGSPTTRKRKARYRLWVVLEDDLPARVRDGILRKSRK